MNFDEFIRMKALQEKQLHHMGSDMDLVDMAIAQNPENAKQLRNVCAMVSVPLFEDIETICNLFSISKRRFVEYALVEAVDKTKKIVEEVKPFGEQEII